jgi:hypothetical protein
MKRIWLLLVIIAVTAPGASAFDRTTPTLRIVTRAPLVVSGTHFRAAERVTIKAAGITRVVRTTGLGAFRANLGAMSSDRCSFQITALGARGDHAMLAARAMCAPAMTP